MQREQKEQEQKEREKKKQREKGLLVLLREVLLLLLRVGDTGHWTRLSSCRRFDVVVWRVRVRVCCCRKEPGRQEIGRAHV